MCIDEDDVLGRGKRFADYIAQETSRKTVHDWYERALGHLWLAGCRSPQALYQLGYPSDMLDYRSLTYSRILSSGALAVEVGMALLLEAEIALKSVST